MNTSFINLDIEKHYQRWLPIALEADLTISDCKVKVSDVLRAHYTIVDYFVEEGDSETAVGGIGPMDMKLLISAVSRQSVGSGEHFKWNDHFEKAATLTFGIVKNHAFHDCNKRTGLLTLLYYIDSISRTPISKQRDFERLMIQIADNKLYNLKDKLRVRDGEDLEVRIIAEFIRKNTRKIDNRQYEVTFHELQAILKRFGYALDHPKKNYIDLVRFIQKKKTTEITKIATLGFPGWSRKVALKDLKIVRKSTRLTADRGVDSKVFYQGYEPKFFYQGVDPLKVLVDDYRGPLKRLADR